MEFLERILVESLANMERCCHIFAKNIYSDISFYFFARVTLILSNKRKMSNFGYQSRSNWKSYQIFQINDTENSSFRSIFQVRSIRKDAFFYNPRGKDQSSFHFGNGRVFFQIYWLLETRFLRQFYSEMNTVAPRGRRWGGMKHYDNKFNMDTNLYVLRVLQPLLMLVSLQNKNQGF